MGEEVRKAGSPEVWNAAGKGAPGARGSAFSDSWILEFWDSGASGRPKGSWPRVSGEEFENSRIRECGGSGASGRGKGSWPRVFWKEISGEVVTSQPSLVMATEDR